MRGTERDRSTGWLAFAWALLFAALTFYWAAGGTAGVHTLSKAIREPALRRDGGFVAILWATGDPGQGPVQGQAGTGALGGHGHDQPGDHPERPQWHKQPPEPVEENGPCPTPTE